MSLAEAMMNDFDMALMESLNTTENVGELEEIGDDVNMEVTEYYLDKKASEISKLKDSDRLKEVMESIRKFKDLKKEKRFGSFETDPEYELIVRSNDLITEIDNEMNAIHKYVKDIYAVRFPELATVVADPIEYIRAVKIFANDISNIPRHAKHLEEFIISSTVMCISVSAAKSNGVELTECRLYNALEACDIAIQLHQYKEFILQFVESRMPFFAPNLSAVLGPSVAAKLMGRAGGLKSLANTPSCNLLNFGSSRKADFGVANPLTKIRGGYIFNSPQVQQLKPDIRMKAAKLYANKAVLSARIDLSYTCRDGKQGIELRDSIQKSIDKWLEPPPVKAIKPLPAPIDLPSKRRGGRRYRKRKERLGMTEVRKSANRMEFGGIEDSYDNEMTVNAGRLGRTNKIRAPVADAKTKARVSKTLSQKLQKQQQAQTAIWGGTTTVKKHISGATTSVAFTPLKGVEISNPLPVEAKQETGTRYFSTAAAWIKK